MGTLQLAQAQLPPPSGLVNHFPYWQIIPPNPVAPPGLKQPATGTVGPGPFIGPGGLDGP